MRNSLLSLLLFILTYSTVLVSAQTYSYPDIPDSITIKTERVAYMAYHFWDHADFSDSTLLSKPKLVLDYLYLTRQLNEIQRSECFKNTINRISINTHIYNNMLFWIERYLHNPRSPYFSDETFVQVIDAMLESSAEEENARELLYLRELLQKNQIGTVAENFEFKYKDGFMDYLFDIDAPLLLLIFNSPDCSLCHNLEQKISQNESIQQMVSNGQLKILAISPMADYDDWSNHKYPQNWICGFDDEMTIIKERLYEIKQFPSIYLLDEDKRVIIKEADYELLTSVLLGEKNR